MSISLIPVRFAIAAHRLADYEHNCELLPEELSPVPVFHDCFLCPIRFYSPPLEPPDSPIWLFQAALFINKSLCAHHLELCEIAAMEQACIRHEAALEALLATCDNQAERD